VPDFDDIVESGGAQFRGDVCEHIPLGCLRVGVGHRRSLSPAGGLGPHRCNDTISPILPTDDAIDAQRSTNHDEHSRRTTRWVLVSAVICFSLSIPYGPTRTCPTATSAMPPRPSSPRWSDSPRDSATASSAKPSAPQHNLPHTNPTSSAATFTAPGFSPVGIRPANHAVAVPHWCTGYVYLLGRHAARARRTRYVRRPRRTNLETSALEGKPYNLGRETDATQWSFGQSDVSMRITPRSQALSARRGQAAVDGRSPWPRRQASRT